MITKCTLRIFSLEDYESISNGKGVTGMNIKSQLSNVIKKKLFNTFIINEEVFSQMAENIKKHCKNM